MRGKHSVGEIIKSFKGELENERVLSLHQSRTLGALESCRTAALGGHVDACPCCGTVAISYNSCRNRHCPLCQGTQRERWIQARKKAILPIKYFHVVFTVPDALNPLFLYKKEKMYPMLFKVAWQTIDKFARSHGIQCGMTALLHTWGSALQYHPHLHCIVPAGGVDKQGRWKALPGADNEAPYLFPVKAMSAVFRAKFAAALTKEEGLEGKLRKELFEKDWVVYCKRPFKVGDVIEYLGRYSHRVAISNSRITKVDQESVTFNYKDYKAQGMTKQMTLSGREFLRRFSLHILPPGCVRIRHYGFMASCNKSKVQAIKEQLEPASESRINQATSKETKEEAPRPNSYICPACGEAYMVCIQIIAMGRDPPVYHHNSNLNFKKA